MTADVSGPLSELGLSIFPSFADVALLMYDITNLDSFMNLRMWKNFFSSEVRERLVLRLCY
jgi:hypothetical protein